MYGRGTLAATGAGFTIAGLSMSISLIAAIAVAVVVLGALTYRHVNRKKRYVV